MIDDLPPELDRLFAAERAAPIDAGLRSAVRAKIAASVAGTPLGVGGVTLAGKILTVLVLAIGAGALVRSQSSAESSAKIAPIAPIAPIAHVEPWELTHESPDPAPPTVVQHPVTRETAVSSEHQAIVEKPPSRVVTIVRSQTELLKQAWLALDRDPADALRLAQQDERDHAHGLLSEERAALEIVALSKIGRIDEARAAAQLFDQQYPTSVHRELVTHALQGSTP